MPDIQNMRAAGVNAIKLYAGNPALNAGEPGSAGNWKSFLDACYNNGTNPIYVVMFSYIQGDVIAAGGAAYQQYITDYQNLVRSTVTHPAILGYCVGNEIFGGVTSSAQFWTNFGDLLNAAKEAGEEQNATPFLMSATNDDYTPAQTWPAIQLGENSNQLANLDAWGINVYRGPLFGGAGNSVFLQYQALMASLNKTKPLILGEWGTPHSTRPAVLTPPDPPPGYYSTTGIPGVPPLISTTFRKIRWGLAGHILRRQPPRSSWPRSGRRSGRTSAREQTKSVWVDLSSTGQTNTGRLATPITTSVVPIRVLRAGRSPAAMRMKPGTGSRALSINRSMEITSQTSTERFLRPTPGYEPSILRRRT